MGNGRWERGMEGEGMQRGRREEGLKGEGMGMHRRGEWECKGGGMERRG